MTYYGGTQLARSFRTVRQNTLKMAEEIPEEQYGFKASGDTKPIGQLLAHIALGNRFQHQVHAVDRRSTMDGFNFPAFMQQMAAEEQKPRTKAEILEFLTREGEAWASWLDGLSEDFLQEVVQGVMGIPPRTRFEMLLSPKEHEMHHRGQLMLIQRMIGITPHLTRQMEERMAARR